MGFTVPAFLAALVFAGIPFFVHLVFRRRAQQVFFAATRFVKAACVRTARRRRIDNLLLLLLRTLLFGLLAFGLAGPYLRRATATGRSGTDVVIIFDNSLSMAAGRQGETPITRAKGAVDTILSKVRGGDLVGLLCTAPPERSHDTGLTGDISAVRERVARITVSNARGSLAGALERAASILGESAATGKLLYVITDLQANSFPGESALSDKTRSVLAATPAILYDCGSETPRNLYISKLAVSTQGGVVGTPIEVTAKVTSNSPVQETVPVTLLIGNERVQSRTVTAPPGGSVDVSLSAIIPSAGALDGAVEVETEDAISADNRRRFSLIARDRIKALILEAGRRVPEFDDDSFFLLRALEPFGSPPSGGRSPFDAEVKTYDDAGSVSAYDIVYVLLRAGLPEALSNELSDYVKGGGSLVVFVCDDPAAEGLQTWLPARLVGLKSSDPNSGKSFSIGGIDADSPALAAFKDEPRSLYANVRVYDYWTSDVVDKSATVLMRYDTGDPAAILSSPVPGRVVLFTVAPIRSMSTFPASGFFLPSLYEISYYLVSSTGGTREVFAGDALVLAAAGSRPAGMVVTSPEGQQRLVTAEPGQALTYTDTSLPGSYRAREPESAADTMTFSVNTDPAESDLARLDSRKISAALPDRPVSVVSSTETLDEALLSLEPVLALGDAILYAVVVLALFECLAASRVSGRSAVKDE